MPVTWKQKAVGLSGEHGTNTDYVEIPYAGSGDGEYEDARLALLDAIPDTLDGRVFDTVRVEELGGGKFEGTARYKSDASNGGGPGTSLFSFATGGGTKHITHTEGVGDTTGYTTDGPVAPDVKGTIGEPDGGVPAGVDIGWAAFDFTVTAYFSNDQVTLDFLATLNALTFTVNNAPFKSLQAGECLFRGASGAKRSGGDWEISFAFSAKPNRVGFTIGDIGIPRCDGWDVVDIRYQFKDVSNNTVQQPRAVYIHKVYPRKSFSLLGISTTLL